MARPGESIRHGLCQAHVWLQRMNVLSMTAPGDDNDDQFSPDTDPPQFILFGEYDQDEDSDTVSEGPAERYEDFSVYVQNTFLTLLQDYFQEPDLTTVHREEVPNLSNTSSSEIAEKGTRWTIREIKSQTSQPATTNVLTRNASQDFTLVRPNWIQSITDGTTYN